MANKNLNKKNMDNNALELKPSASKKNVDAILVKKQSTATKKSDASIVDKSTNNKKVEIVTTKNASENIIVNTSKMAIAGSKAKNTKPAVTKSELFKEVVTKNNDFSVTKLEKEVVDNIKKTISADANIDKNKNSKNKSSKLKTNTPSNVLSDNSLPKKSFKVVALQFLAFLCFSLGAAVIEISSFSIIILMGSIVVADVISVILSCLFNFTLNRKYTFKSVNNIYLGMILYGIFYLVFTPLGAWFIKALVDTGMNDFLAKFIKMLINFVLDFCFCKFVVFRVKAPKQKQPKETIK